MNDLPSRVRISQIRVFFLGAVVGAVFGAIVLGPVVHFLLIGAIVAGVGAALYRGRRIVLARTRADKRLKA